MKKDFYEATYPLRIRIVFIAILVCFITAFYINPSSSPDIEFETDEEYTEIVKVEIIEELQQQQKIKSQRPSIPIEQENEALLDTTDFMDTANIDIDLVDIGSSTPSVDRPTWVAFDQAPKPKKALKPKYPDICKQAGVEGRVVVSFWVYETGSVDPGSIKIIQSVPCLDQYIIDEIKKSKWRPAKQGSKKIGTPVTQHFDFKLN